MTTTTNGDARAAAVEEWLAGVETGRPLSGAELGRRYGRSDSWGRAVARQAAAAHQQERRTPPVAGHAVEGASETVEGVTDQMVAASTLVVAEPVPPWVRRLTVTAVLLVAVAAAVASTEHLADVARIAGTGGGRAWLLPAAVDGLAVAAALTLYSAHLRGGQAGVLPWLALSGGLAASVAGNIVSVYPELADVGHLKVAVGATPPLALALAIELALRQIRTTNPQENQ